ncbi:serine/threonine-protein kinase [Actinokineospora guangxiensis]|uniref:non-specific serine/threonine protein kinase n=1 Tax=Actinokineospora guangxiensis TaxID=1490288 RepID=A0ABW0EGZ6_9PSEU
MLTSGQLLADRYRLSRRIAVGGMGEVWEAADTRLDRAVAVKVLKPELCGDAEFLHRFRTEARTTASLNHPGIAAVHDYGETAAIVDGPKDTAYLIMELVEGEPLAAIVSRDGRMNADRVLDILEQAGFALQAAHERGYVHRDVKPGNILITPSGVVKLTDFGIAKAADAAPVTRSGMVMGTAHYIAPEQALGHEAEPASDVYSLAVVGYECLMGHRPFLSENAVTVAMMHIRDAPPPLPPDVPPGARAVIEATLVKDPRRRYGSGGEFAAAVAAVRAGRPLPAPTGYARAGHPGTHPGMHPVQGTGTFAPVPPPAPQERSRTGLWVTIVVLAVALIAALAIGLPAVMEDDGGSGGAPADSTVTTPQTPGRGDSEQESDAAPTTTAEPEDTEPGGPPSMGEQPVAFLPTPYLGQSAMVAAEDLAANGVAVDVRTEDDERPENAAACAVVGSVPEGPVYRGDTVTIVCRPQGGSR